MRLKTRIHEWLADRFDAVQYPQPIRFEPNRRPTLAQRWRVMPPKQRAWVWFAVFWGGVVLLSIYGNLID